MLDPSRFAIAVEHLVAPLRLELAGRQFSDVLDAEGRQYVDLVLEGGGMLGIALVGYTYVLEQIGIRFLSLGGTSAGAINALLLAALETRDKAKTDDMVRLLANQNFYEFIDGDADARRVIGSTLRGSGLLSMLYAGVQVRDNLEDHWGLNPGTVFYEWLRAHLHEAGVHTWADLRARLEAGSLVRRTGEKYELPPAEKLLAIVAAEITTETKVIFPRMAPLFWEEPERVHPAEYARASMSIPFFFHPVRIRPPHDMGSARRWIELASFDGPPPEECLLVDGGILSNFPIDIFHAPHRVPAAPTFGAKLGVDRSYAHPVQGPLGLARAMFNTARHGLDYDFIIRNPDYRGLVTSISTQGFNWLDFAMPDEDKLALFTRGAEAACSFLRLFDWAKYKELRRHLSHVHGAPDQPVVIANGRVTSRAARAPGRAGRRGRAAS